MLSKLLKHEFKATARYLIPLYIIAFVLTIVDRIVLNLDIFEGYLSIIPGFITFAYVLALVAVVIVSFLVVILRFYKNLLGDEGYLMFTLPVKSEQLISSKLISSVIWAIVSTIVVFASALGVSSTAADIKEIILSLKEFWGELQSMLGTGKLTLLIIEFIILVIVSLITSILMFYVSIAIGQLFHGHRVIGAVLSYIGIYMALQLVTTILIVIIGLIVGKDIFNDATFVPEFLFPMLILYQFLIASVYFLVTNYLMKRKLNLE